MDFLHILFSVIVIAAIAGIVIYFTLLKPRKGDDADKPATTNHPLKFDFCVGTYVNSDGELRKALGVKLQGSSIYYCIKNTVHDINYTFKDTQIAWFKNKFAKVFSENYFHSLIYYSGNCVTPLIENI